MELASCGPDGTEYYEDNCATAGLPGDQPPGCRRLVRLPRCAQGIRSGRYDNHSAGSGGTARETVEIFALYRAAEVTLANGRDRFAVLEWETEATETSWAFEFVPLTLQHESSFGYRKATGFPVPSLRPPVTRTTAWAKIRTLPGEVPEDAPVHDARRVIETYGPGL